jgi:hypothetical protein
MAEREWPTGGSAPGEGRAAVEFETLGDRSKAALIYSPVNKIDRSPE